MNVLLLADSNSPHTLKWAKSIFDSGVNVGIFTLHKPDFDLYADKPQIRIFSFNLPRALQQKKEVNISKLVYLKALKALKDVIKEFNPDIVHAHYASSYGLIGALSGFHPLITSVWGGDIYVFPRYSFLHKMLMKYNLSKADKILSTSHVMKNETQKFTSKEITVTPFGIDINRFYPRKSRKFFNENDIVIGTVKTLKKKYGIEYLIRAFGLVKKKKIDLPLKLLIVGEGNQEQYLKNLCKDLGIEKDTIFTGFIIPDYVPDYHNNLDISVFVSVEDSESFGVAVLEASACEKPVIVSNAGGLPEVVIDNLTGFVVSKINPEETADAIHKLILNKELRDKMGKAGRERVLKYYNWSDNVKQMLQIYNNVYIHKNKE